MSFVSVTPQFNTTPPMGRLTLNADQIVRRLVHAVSKTNVLDNYTVADISQKAASLGIQIDVDNGAIVLPSDRKNIKHLLRFLDDGIYEASLTSERYITNSKRPLN